MQPILQQEEIKEIRDKGYSASLVKLAETGDFSQYAKEKLQESYPGLFLITVVFFCTLLVILKGKIGYPLNIMLIILEIPLSYIFLFSIINTYVYLKLSNNPKYIEPAWFTRMYGGAPIQKN